MQRKLNENDRKKTIEFLSKEPSINLFIIGDIENYGFDKSFQELWGSFDKDNYLEAVLLRYYESFILYSNNDDFDFSGFIEIILAFKGKKIVSGKMSIIKKLDSLFPDLTFNRYYFCELSKRDDLVNYSDLNIKIAKPKDASKICSLMAEIEEFTTEFSKERVAKSIMDKSKRIYYIENEHNKVITTVQTTAENSKSAMIVGVATKKSYRKKGLMSACLSKMCEDVLYEGKTLCLFYDNPKAGSVYMKLGFKQIDDWAMYK